MRIYNIGVYPPPIGGVSNHIKRLHDYLLERGRESFVIDCSRTNKQGHRVMLSSPYALAAFLWRPRSVLHFHTTGWKFTVLMFILSFRHVVVFSVHNERFTNQAAKLRGLRRRLLRLVYNRLTVVTDNPACCRWWRDDLGLKRVVMIPEFIPSDQLSERDSELLRPYRDRFDILLGSNAFEIAFHNGEDLYGLDILVEMLNELSRDRNVGLLFLLPGRAHEEYLKIIERRVKDYGLQGRFVVVREPLEDATSLWRISDIVIRATNTDGNSLTVYEALYAGTPVIASDCVNRPDGVMLFKNRDVGDLARVVDDTINNLGYHKIRTAALKIENNAGKIDALYSELIGGSR